MSEQGCPSEAELLAAASGEDVPARAHSESCESCGRRIKQIRLLIEAIRSSSDELTITWNGSAAGSACTEGAEAALYPAYAGRHGPAATAPAPERIGDYTVVAPLGGPSGEAEVYLGIHPRLHTQVAIKWSRWPVPPNADPRRLADDARLLAALKHPGLIAVHDVGVHDGRVFVVMEYVEGKTLAQYALSARPGPQEAARLVAELADTVEFIHRRGVIHQDLKPQNVLLDPALRTRLIDFGLARLRSYWASEQSPGKKGGTLAYMAPEQARGEPATERTDVFGLGAVLFFLLTGRAPYSGRSRSELRERAIGCDWDRPALAASGAPRRLQAICARAMSADPADRFDSAAAMSRALKRFLRWPVWRLRAIVAAAALLAAFTAWILVALTRQPGTPAVATPRVRVARDGRELDLADALPLHSGDCVHVRWRVPSGWHAKLFWFDTEQKLTPLQMVPAAVAEAAGSGGQEVVWPAEDKAMPLVGPPGTELLVFLALPDRAPGRADLPATLLGQHAWPELPHSSRLLISPDLNPPIQLLAARGPGANAQQRPAAKLHARAEQLFAALSERFNYFVAVAFPHAPVRDQPH